MPECEVCRGVGVVRTERGIRRCACRQVEEAGSGLVEIVDEPVRPPANLTDTSQAAADAAVWLGQRLRREVLRAIVAAGGLTCFEVEERLGLKHQTASARIWELHQRNFIRDSGDRRATGGGRGAIVWVEV